MLLRLLMNNASNYTCILSNFTIKTRKTYGCLTVDHVLSVYLTCTHMCAFYEKEDYISDLGILVPNNLSYIYF